MGENRRYSILLLTIIKPFIGNRKKYDINYKKGQFFFLINNNYYLIHYLHIYIKAVMHY